MIATPNLTEFTSKSALQKSAAAWISRHLADAISRRGSAVFMASGGRTPGPIYQELAKTSLDWSSVLIGLTDERWVEEGHPASNSAMVRETLLVGAASAAAYIPMKLSGTDAFAAVEQLDEIYLDAGLTDVMLLGMGPDAHTLSWFAGGRGYGHAIDPFNPSTVAAVEAIESEVTGPNTMRMTLTQPCVANARHVLLLITGADKREVFETAGPETPVGIMRAAAGLSLTVFYTE